MDYFIFHQINNLAGKNVCLDSLGIFFAKYLIYLLIISVILFFLKKWRVIIQAFLAAFLAKFIIIDLIKFLWERPRPFIENNVNQILEYTGASFPSGHAAISFALSTVIFLYYKKNYPRPKFWWGVGIIFFIASFLISISRVFVGIHWPSDILAGAVIGIFCGWLVVRIFNKF